MKPIYTMSTVGNCSRVLGAIRLGNKPTPLTKDDLARLQHYSRCEALAAQQIMDLGYKLEEGGECKLCHRNGIHVQIDTPLFLLVGHLDRRLVLNGSEGPKFPVEIKSLGKTSHTRFARNQFNSFPDYAGQEVCYLHAEQKPGMYWIMERDSGSPLKYTIDYGDNELKLDGFEKIILPVTFEQIVDKLNLIEVAVQDNTLPDAEESDSCFFCHFKYLCVKPEPKGTKAVIETLPALVEAAGLYTSGLQMEKDGKSMKKTGTDILLEHAKGHNVDKYRVGNVISVTYSGQTTRKTLNRKILLESLQELAKKYKMPLSVPEEIVRLSTKESEPYDDFDIRVLKEG